MFALILHFGNKPGDLCCLDQLSGNIKHSFDLMFTWQLCESLSSFSSK